MLTFNPEVLTMSGVDAPSRAPKILYTFNSRASLQDYITGCDADIGGTSTVHLTLDESGPKPSAKFWGEMRLGVRSEVQGRVLGGYAGFRSIHRTTMFGEMMHDLSAHNFLGIRLRLRGSPRTRNSYFVNIQTDGYVTTDLWQHRLYFNRDDGEWEDIYIPLRSFVLTHAGEIVGTEMEMSCERIRTIGISLLGGKNGIEGPYELSIDSIRAVNSEDVTKTPMTQNDPSRGTQWQRGAL